MNPNILNSIDKWEKIKRKIFKRDKYQCQRCFSSEKLTVHHIQPREYGGKNDTKNLITLCKDCHNFIEEFCINGRYVPESLIRKSSDRAIKIIYTPDIQNEITDIEDDFLEDSFESGLGSAESLNPDKPFKSYWYRDGKFTELNVERMYGKGIQIPTKEKPLSTITLKTFWLLPTEKQKEVIEKVKDNTIACADKDKFFKLIGTADIKKAA